MNKSHHILWFTKYMIFNCSNGRFNKEKWNTCRANVCIPNHYSVYVQTELVIFSILFWFQKKKMVLRSSSLPYFLFSVRVIPMWMFECWLLRFPSPFFFHFSFVFFARVQSTWPDLIGIFVTSNRKCAINFDIYSNKDT